MLKYRIKTIRLRIPYSRYVGIYDDLPDIIFKFITEQLNGIVIPNELIHDNCLLSYNGFKEEIVYENHNPIHIDEKTHHKMLLLNKDYTQQELERRYRIFRYPQYDKDRLFSIIVEGYDDEI